MSENLARLLLRLTIGGNMLLHGISKLTHGIDGIVERVVAHGLPSAFAYGVYVGEVLAPVLMIIGLATRASAWLVAFTMVVAIWLAHAGDVFALGDHGSWAIELQSLFLFGSIAVALLGPGKWSIKNTGWLG